VIHRRDTERRHSLSGSRSELQNPFLNSSASLRRCGERLIGGSRSGRHPSTIVLVCREMVRLIALFLALSVVGVLLADAQCGALCSTRQCSTPRTSTGCHHNRSERTPAFPQCLHQHGITPIELTLAPATIIPLRIVAVAPIAPPPLVFESVNQVTPWSAPGAQPSETPPNTPLRI